MIEPHYCYVDSYSFNISLFLAQQYREKPFTPPSQLTVSPATDVVNVSQPQPVLLHSARKPTFKVQQAQHSDTVVNHLSAQLQSAPGNISSQQQTEAGSANHSESATAPPESVTAPSESVIDQSEFDTNQTQDKERDKNGRYLPTSKKSRVIRSEDQQNKDKVAANVSKWKAAAKAKMKKIQAAM